MRRVILPTILILIFIPISTCKKGPRPNSTDLTEARERMITRDLIPRGISDRLVLRAMGEVRREDFVPPEFKNEAYDDRTLPLGILSTISQPYIVALMTEAIQPEPNQKVLEIGTASGYQAAVLSKIVKEVYTIEIVPALADSAAGRLKQLGYNNVFVKTGDGFFGWKEHAPFDGIIVTCAAPRIPAELANQLAEGGKMVLPLGETFSTQVLTVISKKNGEIQSRPLVDVRFVPMQGEIRKGGRP